MAVILYHVTEAATALIIAAARAHADLLRHGDLNAVNVVAVPERLEDGIGETLHQQILDGFLAQIVIDAIDLVLLKHGAHHPVQLAGGVQVAPERFLDDDLGVKRAAELAPRQTTAAEVGENGGKHGRRRGDVKEHLHLATQAGLDRVDLRSQTNKGLLLVIAARHVAGTPLQARPDLRSEFTPRKLTNGRRGQAAEFLVRNFLATETNQVEIRGQQVVEGKIIDGGDELACGQVAGGAKDHHHGGGGPAMLAQA